MAAEGVALPRLSPLAPVVPALEELASIVPPELREDVEMARHNHQSFDLLLSDLGLPDRSGLELMQELHQRGQGIPGIALSGYGQEEDIRRSREAGFREHLTKPVNLGQLEAAIGRVVG